MSLMHTFGMVLGDMSKPNHSLVKCYEHLCKEAEVMQYEDYETHIFAWRGIRGSIQSIKPIENASANEVISMIDSVFKALPKISKYHADHMPFALNPVKKVEDRHRSVPVTTGRMKVLIHEIYPSTGEKFDFIQQMTAGGMANTLSKEQRSVMQAVIDLMDPSLKEAANERLNGKSAMKMLTGLFSSRKISLG